MSLETQSERFIETLKALGGSAGNGSLNNELGWADSTYQRVKAYLIEAGTIVPGRGRGGSVALASNKLAPKTKTEPARKTVERSRSKIDKGTNSGGGNYAQAFNAIDKAMRNDEGLASELDYAEQTSWLLFLKYLDDMEHEWADEAALKGKTYMPILAKPYRWQDWAAPKTSDGKPDPNAKTGSDLIDFVNGKLVPHLKSFKDSSVDADSLQYKIGEIFSEVANRFRSGYTLRDVLEIVDSLSFGSSEAKHELSDLYETRIKRMGNAGRNGGEYYTPRPLIRAMIQVLQPQIGETIYDGACGSAGFLCEAWEHLRRADLSAKDWDTLQRRTFYGQEKKSLAYVLGVMNMILHGIDAPNIRHVNTLAFENVMDIQQKDRHDIVLANPPFGGGERPEVQQNFPIRSSETAYLFLQHFIRKLKAGGRAAIVIKNTFLSKTDNASVELRRELLASCNLHTVLDCPGGTFQGAGVKTVVLFFEKGAPTRKTWYYQLDPGRSLGKTNPLNDADLAEFVQLQKTKAGSEKSWAVDVADVDAATCDLSVKNPHIPEAAPQRTPRQIIDDMLARDEETAKLLAQVKEML